MNVESLSILHSSAAFLGLAPNITKNKNKLAITRNNSDLLPGIITLLILAIAMVYLFYGKIFHYGAQIQISVLITFSIMEIVVTICNIASIYLYNLRNGIKYLKLVEKLQQLEEFIIETENIPQAAKSFVLYFMISIIANISFGCFSAYLYIAHMGWDIYKYYACREFQHILVHITMEITIRYPQLMGLRMKELNEHLKRCVLQRRLSSTNGFWKELNEIKVKPRITLDNVSDGFTTIVELVEEYNELMGPLGLLFSGNMILNILVPVNMALLYMHGISVHNQHQFGIAFIVYCVFWIAFPCVVGMKLCIACDTVEKEAGKVPLICYSLMKTLGEHEFKLKNDLESYAGQAERLKPKFSAGGYFDVNKGLTMTIFGSVFTYIIVLMQFHNM